MFKKTISIFLVISIIVGLLCFNVSADKADDLELIFEDDFEVWKVGDAPTYNTGDFSKWTSVVKSDASPVFVQETDGNKFLSLGRSADQIEAGGPRVEKLLPIKGNSVIRVCCKVQTNGQVFQLSVRSADNSESSMVFNFSGDDVLGRAPDGMKLRSDKFVDLEVEINCLSMKFTSYINGKVYKRNQSLNSEIPVDDGVRIRFGTSVQPGNELYLDDVAIYSDDEALKSGKIIDVLSLKTDSNVLLTPYIRKSHPKLYTDDFDKIRDKIKNDQLASNLYQSVKANADSLLKAEPEAYAPESDILTNVSRRIRAKLYSLAFVYAIEEDDVYKERALEEIRNADNFPSWHPNNFLGVAELGGGVAIAYDWMYNGMTEEEREYVRSVILDHTLYLGALSYEGISDVFFVTATSNWNFVCNGGLVISALAISEDYPQLADYIFNKAAESLPYATEITFAPQGASPEGPGYWDYAAYNFINMIAAIDSATIDGKKIPAKFDFSDTVGLSETIYFPIATNSSVGRFNYGDNVPAYGQNGIDLSIAYWMAEKYNKPEYAKYQMQKRDLKGDFGSAWETTLKLMWYNPSLVADVDAEFPLDKFYIHDNGPNLVTLRSGWEDEIYVGMQGGLNGASHSFLSLGTFIVDALGERWATQIGQGNYRWEGYFSMSDQRWTYYNCHTEGQNCVVLNPDEGPQQNITALAKTVDSYSSADESYGVLDMSSAYDTSVNKYLRGVKLFDGKSRLVIQDDINAKETLNSGYWFMHTDAKVFLDDDGKSGLLVKNGKKMHIQIVSDFENAKFTYVDAKPLPTSQNPEIQQAEDYGKKLSIDLAGAKDIKLAVVFTPLDEGETVGEDSYILTSIEEWGNVKANGADGNAEFLSDVISMYEGSPIAYNKGEIVNIDSSNSNISPVVKNGRTFVPLRFISETLGAQVEWNNEENTVYIKNNLDELKFTIGENAFYKNGIKFETDASAYVFEGRTFVPVRAVSEAFGKNVGWNDGLVTISKFDNVENNAEVVKRLTDKLVYSLNVNGNNIGFFDINDDLCEVYVSPLDSETKIDFACFDKNAKIVVNQPDANGNGSVSVNGKNVNIKLIDDPYFYASGDHGINNLEVADAEFKDMTGVVTWIQPVSAVASLEGAGAVGGICDNNMDTLWSAQGLAHVEYDLGEVKHITSMSLANDYKNGTRKYIFDLQYSNDGVNWSNLLTDTMTHGLTNYPEIYDFEDVDARYIRFVAKGNTTNAWNVFYELRLYESVEQQESDRANWRDYFAKVDWNSFKVGDTLKIAVIGNCNNGTEYKFTDSEILSCTSDNENVLKFNGHVLEAVGSGKAKLTVTVDYHGIQETTEFEVTVTE